MITQDTLNHYISRTASGTTEVKLLSRINLRTGKAKVLIIESGVLEVSNNIVIPDFQLIHGILKFVQKDNEAILN